MIELSLNKVEKSFGFKKILDGFDLELKSGEKVALIGPNGSGKTTIFKMIVGEEKPTGGNIFIRKGATLGMLSQMPQVYDKGVTVRDVIMDSKKEMYDIEKKLREVEEKLESVTNQEALDSMLKNYGRLQEAFENMGGYQLEATINKVCSGFKITDSMMDREYNSLSGGEKTIVNFACLILKEPSILLLDEPTNHLDMDTLEWLEEYLSNYKNAILISSHDRYFLDKVTEKTILIDRGKSEIFFGNYSYYVEENERRLLAEFEDYKDQQKKIEAMKRKIKQLQEFGKLAFPGGEPFFRRAASIQKRLDKLELLDKPEEKKELPLDFQVKQRSGKDVLNVEEFSAIIGDKELFDRANLFIKYGEKACLMGKNGSGKSTLIKMILNNYNPEEFHTDAEQLEGDIKIGNSVVIGYLPQEIKFDDETATILETARKFFDGNETYLRAALAKYLFYGDNVFKRIEKLSGGEKARLKLFELILKKSNFLILDEPTNHIDIDTREMLEEALKEYNGTLLFVSHDRYFINRLAEQTYEIDDKKITRYEGNYNDLKSQKAKRLELVNNKSKKR